MASLLFRTNFKADLLFFVISFKVKSRITAQTKESINAALFFSVARNENGIHKRYNKNYTLMLVKFEKKRFEKLQKLKEVK
jgi:hypothetical protein